MESKMDSDARHERNTYQREWRALNKERIRQYNAEYWKRRAEKRKSERGENHESHGNERQ